MKKIFTTLLLLSTWLMVASSPAAADNPSTVIDISATATEVSAGDTIELTIVETNDGSVRLMDVSVDLTENVW